MLVSLQCFERDVTVLVTPADRSPFGWTVERPLECVKTKLSGNTICVIRMSGKDHEIRWERCQALARRVYA